MSPLLGTAAHNKGMALFPRRINGKYAMIARQDNENLYLIYSDDLYRWDGGQAILEPEFPWEFVQLGTADRRSSSTKAGCCSPTASPRSANTWIGAALLDKNDPLKVLARSREPLLTARTVRARGLRSQCRLHLWRNEAQRPDHLAIRRIRHVLQFRDRQDRNPAEHDEELIAQRHDATAQCRYQRRQEALWPAKQAISFSRSMPARAEA